MTKMIVLTTIFGLFSFSGIAQNQLEASGQVKDLETKENIPYSKVVALDANDSIVSGGITDEKGFFKLPLNPGQYQLVISTYGYDTDTVATGVLREDSFLGIFKLQPSVTDLEGVDIQVSSRIDALDKEIQIITETEKKGATAAKDVLNKISGISYDDYSGTLKVDNDANIMILVNGVEKSQEYIQNLDPERLLRVETTRDPGGRYGLEGYTAILNVILKSNYTGTEVYLEEMQLVDIDTERSRMLLMIGSFGGTYNYTRDNLNIYGGMQLEHKHFELTSESQTEYENNIVALEQANSDDPNTLITQYDARYTLGFDYRINPKHVISFESNIIALPLGYEELKLSYQTSIYSNDSLLESYKFNSKSNNKNWDTYNSLFYIGEFNKRNKLNVNFTYSNYRNFYTNITSQEGAYSRIEKGINKKQYSRFYAEFDHVISAKTNIQVGYGNTWRKLNNEYELSHYDVISSETIAISDDFKLSDVRHKLYSNYSWRINKKWGARIGLAAETSSPRVDDKQLTYFIYQPMFDLKYTPSQKVNVKLKYRTSSSYPTIAQTNPFISQINPRITSTGNAFLRPSTTHQFSLRINLLQGLLALEPYIHYSNNTIAQIGELGADNVFNFRFENVNLYQRTGGKLNFNKYIEKISFLIETNIEVFESKIVSSSGVNSFIDWRADANLLFIFPKSEAILGLNYQRQQTKIINGLGYDIGDVDFWLILYKQPLFKKKASIMFGYFLPLDWGTDYNQASHIETSGFSMHTDNDVSLVKNMFLIEFSYRFNKGNSIKKTQKKIDKESEEGGGGFL